MRVVPAVIVALCAGCGDDLHGNVSIDPGRYGFAIGELVAMTPYTGLSIGTGGDFQISIVDDDAALPAESYRVEQDASAHWRVHAHDVLGAQYGVADALENLGFRFRHPFDTYVPVVPSEGATELGVTHRPQIRVRGLHLHTLHPIEGYFAMIEPSPGATNDAHRIINWLIANRGNYIQWAPLDDILDPQRYAAWQTFTREIIDYAHARGVRVGLDIQLYGQSSYQNAFVLSVDKSGTVPIATEIAARLPLVTQDLPIDVLELTFGEFMNSDPDAFIAATNEVRAQLRVLAPQAEMHAVIHVGASQRITYMGENIIYYFLVKFADPSIVPDVHTVMYYDLFENAGGAYGQEDFAEHRAYLEDRMCAGLPVAYHPETAYWITFDDSVPQMLPLYVRTRWTDLHELAALGCGPLDEHLIFSSGWEWSYWLHDVATLRASYELPGAPQDIVVDELAPDLGKDAGAIVDRVASAQHDALMSDRLAAYIAGRDIQLDFARELNGVVSEPDRITFDDLVASGDVDGFTASVLAPLERYASTLDQRQAELDALELPESRWASELRDGVAIDRIRAHFVAAVYGVVIDHLRGGDGKAALATANELFAQARAVVDARHADLHDTHGRRLVDHTANRTQYGYGYLYMADQLCYWNRELIQAETILGNATMMAPPCLY